MCREWGHLLEVFPFSIFRVRALRCNPYQLKAGKRDESLKVTFANGEQVIIEEPKPRLKEYNETMGK